MLSIVSFNWLQIISELRQEQVFGQLLIVVKRSFNRWP